MNVTEAVRAIERRGIMLVFPLENRPDPPSLWAELHPRRQLRWAWDDGADPDVVALWHLRGRLAGSRQVVYGKWFRGRATLFSRAVYGAMLAEHAARGADDHDAALPREARIILEALKENSPQSPKTLRAATGLNGRAFERDYERGLRALWSRLLVVGAGEVADGSFPSLALAATSVWCEDLWLARRERNAAGARQLDEALRASPALARIFARQPK